MMDLKSNFQNLLQKLLSYLVMSIVLCLAACDNRKPLEIMDKESPGHSMVFSRDSVFTYSDSLIVEVGVSLLNKDRGVIDSGVVHFTAQVGFISGVVPITQGVATASYHPIQKDEIFIDTLKVFFIDPGSKDTVRGTKTITILPKEQTTGGAVGAVKLFTSTPQLAVKGSGGREQAIISATVTDVFGSPVKDGVPIVFTIFSAPAGDELINDVGTTDTASTLDGVAQIILHSGSSVGIVVIRAFALEKPNPVSITLSITSGPPAKIDLDLLENNITKSGGRWVIPIHAILTDFLSNPVQDSIIVLYNLDASRSIDQKILIENSGLTGVNPMDSTDTIPGVAVSRITFDTEVIFDSIYVEASTLVGQDTIKFAQWFTIPLPPDVNVVAEYFGGAINVNTFPRDTAVITGTLADDENFPIPGARLCAATDVGVVVPVDSLSGNCGITDSTGQVVFKVVFSGNDQINALVPIQTNNVVITAPAIQKQSAVSFQIKF